MNKWYRSEFVIVSTTFYITIPPHPHEIANDVLVPNKATVNHFITTLLFRGGMHECTIVIFTEVKPADGMFTKQFASYGKSYLDGKFAVLYVREFTVSCPELFL